MRELTLIVGMLLVGCGGGTEVTGAGATVADTGGRSAVETGGGAAGIEMLATGGAEETGGTATGGLEDGGTGPSNTGGAATGGVETCPVGSERCSCYGNGTCDDGLVCLSGLCVDAGTGGVGTGGVAPTGGVATGGTAPTGGVATGGVATGGTSTGGQILICSPGDTVACACNGDWSNPGVSECSPDRTSWTDCVCQEGTGGAGTGGTGTGGAPSCSWDSATLIANPGRRNLDGDGCYVLGDDKDNCIFRLNTPDGFFGEYITIDGISGAIHGPTSIESSGQGCMCPVLLDLQTPDAVVAVAWEYE